MESPPNTRRRAPADVGQIRLRDVGSGPQSIHQFALGHKVFSTTDEAEQGVKGFRSQRNCVAAAFQKPLSGIDFEVVEAIGAEGGTLKIV